MNKNSKIYREYNKKPEDFGYQELFPSNYSINLEKAIETEILRLSKENKQLYNYSLYIHGFIIDETNKQLNELGRQHNKNIVAISKYFINRMRLKKICMESLENLKLRLNSKQAELDTVTKLRDEFDPVINLSGRKIK